MSCRPETVGTIFCFQYFKVRCTFSPLQCHSLHIEMVGQLQNWTKQLRQNSQAPDSVPMYSKLYKDNNIAAYVRATQLSDRYACVNRQEKKTNNEHSVA